MQIALSLGVVFVSTSVFAQDVALTPDWCPTTELWQKKAQHQVETEGSCPQVGTCDFPPTRDFYLVNNNTLYQTIRVHVLVFRESNGTNPAATATDVELQMALFNQDYDPHRIRFEWTWEYIDDSTYRNLGFGDSGAMKATYAVDPDIQCNIYITGFGGGVGTFPWDPAALTSQGGLIVGEDFFGDGFHVISHEMGHNLGLWHTHHGVDEVNQCGECYEPPNQPNNVVGDFCADTPPRPSDFGLCANPSSIDPCSGQAWGYTQPENYMSYGSGDGAGCWTLFTPQQAARMHCWTFNVLNSWEPCGNGMDCNGNLIDDDCDILEGTSLDVDGDGVPDECGGTPGDLDGDGDVDINDLLALLSQWGPCGGCSADLDGDGDVDINDLLQQLANWG